MADGPKLPESEESDDPGRPRTADELDPELLRLPKRRTKIGWLLATAVIAFCAYWMITLRDDLEYSRQGDEPTPMELADLATAGEERFVLAELTPNRAQTARVFAGADLGIHVAPVLGSKGRVWLVTSGSAFASPPRYDNVYAGRTKRLGDLPFYDQLLDYYGRHAAQMDPIDAGILRTSLEKPGPTIGNIHGDRIPRTDESLVEIAWAPKGRAWIIVSPEADGPSDSLAWRTALETRAGLAIRGEIETADPGRVPTWTFEVDAPAGRPAIVAKLAEAGLSAARVTAVSEVITARWAELSPRGDQIVIGQTAIEPDEIREVLISHRAQPEAGATVVIAGETPDDFWYLLPLYILFALLLLLFGWTLFKVVRGSAPPTVA